MGHVGEEFRLVLVGGLDLAALVLDLPEQPGVLDGQGRLGRKGLKQVNDFRQELSRLLPPHRQSAQNSFFTKQWNRQNRSIAEPCQNRSDFRDTRLTLLQDVWNLGWCTAARRLTGGALTRTNRRRLKSLNDLLFHAITRPQGKCFRAFIVLVNNTAVRSRELDRVADDGAKDRREVKSRTNSLAHLSQGFQLFDGSGQLARSRLDLLEQANVLDRDDRLIGEGFEKGDLLV